MGDFATAERDEIIMALRDKIGRNINPRLVQARRVQVHHMLQIAAGSLGVAHVQERYSHRDSDRQCSARCLFRMSRELVVTVSSYPGAEGSPSWEDDMPKSGNATGTRVRGLHPAR